MSYSAEPPPVPSADRWSRWAAPLLLVLVWALTTHRVWLLGHTYLLRDFWTNYVPSRFVLKEAFAHASLPLWDPWIGGGIPVLPDPNNGVFYFPAWPFLLFANQAWALSLAVDLHLLLAALGTYWLARRLCSPWASAAAGAVFGLGGLMQSNVVNVHWAFGYAWAPLWFGALNRLLDNARDAGPPRERWRWAAMLAAVWALQLSACEPQIVYFEGFSLVFVAAAWAMKDARTAAPWKRALPIVIGAGVFAVLAASPQLVALFESLPLSDRAHIVTAESSVWSIRPGRFWELLLPLPWGSIFPTLTFWGKHLVDGPWNGFYFFSLYAGAACVPLSILGLLRLRRSALWLVGGVALLLLCSLARTLAVNDAMRWAIPFWSTFRYPERFVVLPMLALAVLVGLGIDALPNHTLNHAPRWALSLFGLPLLGAAVAWLFPAALGATDTTVSLAETLRPAVMQTLAVGLLSGFIVALAPPRFRSALLASVLALDVSWVSRHVLVTWMPPPTPALLPAYFPGPSNERVLFATQEITDAAMHLAPDPLLRRRFDNSTSRPNLGIERHIRSVSGVTSMEFARSRRLRDTVGTETAWTMFQARSIVADHRHHFSQYKPVEQLPLGLELYRREGPMPEALCVDRWASATGLDAAVAQVRAGHVVEGEPASALPPELGPMLDELTAAKAETECKLSRISSAHWQLMLNARPTPTLVRFSESYFPGWHAHLPSGEALTVRPTDVAFLGMVVPAGTTQVELDFRPRWLTPLLLLSGAAWVLILIGLRPVRPRAAAHES